MKLELQIPEHVRAQLFSSCGLDVQKWSQAEEWINTAQEGFMKCFKKDYPALSETDYLIVMFIRIGLNHKEIARMGNVTQNHSR